MKNLILVIICTFILSCSKEVLVKARSYKDGQAYFIYNRPIWLFRVKTDYTGMFYYNAVINRKTGDMIDNVVF